MSSMSQVNEGFKRKIIIDGVNIFEKLKKRQQTRNVFSFRRRQQSFVDQLQICINYFREKGHDVTAVVPEDIKQNHPDLENCENIKLAPSEPGLKEFILDKTADCDGAIISCYDFGEHLNKKASWDYIIKKRVINYIFHKGRLEPHPEPYGKNGITLDEILYKK